MFKRIIRVGRRVVLRLGSIGTVVFAASWSAVALQAETPGVWVAGDFHNHTRLTDGSHPLSETVGRGIEQFGLSWFVNAEHGGAYGRDPKGRYWEDPAIQPPVKLLGQPRFDKYKRRQMWRWQSILEYSWPVLMDVRQNSKFAGNPIMLGLELNCPGHDHVSVCILADGPEPIAEFGYRFDFNDADDSGGPGGKWQGKNFTNDHTKALEAISWLDENYRDRSWFIPNHSERAGKVRIEDLRDFNNAAPRIAFGFEGAPGHQKYPRRGGYAEKSYTYNDGEMGGATYGGVGVFVARVGGVWDALLGEGRHFFTYANADFHDEGRDFFPGQYQKTYIKVSGPLTDRAVLEGLRSGRSFFVAGDLVDAVEFEARSGRGQAGMGDSLRLRRGADVQITIRLHDPPGKNHLGDEVALQAVDLIGGDITGPVSKYLDDGTTPNPAYTVDVNPSTRVLARFDSSNWKTQADGWISASYTIKNVDRDMYLRLRGTNLRAGTLGQTDQAGNPLSDNSDEQDVDGIDEARADLWFYSNPVFVRLR